MHTVRYGVLSIEFRRRYLSELQRMYVFKGSARWPADHGLKSIPRFDLRSRGPVVDRVIKKRPHRDLERIMIPNSFRDHSLWLIWLVRPRSRSTGKWSQSQSASEKNKTSRSHLSPARETETLPLPVSLHHISPVPLPPLPFLLFCRSFHLFCLHTIMRASHVEKGLFAARDRKCRASLIIGCTTTTILERLSFRHRAPRSPGPRGR